MLNGIRQAIVSGLVIEGKLLEWADNHQNWFNIYKM